MPRKPMTLTRWFVGVREKICRVLGRRRSADLFRVRLLEGDITPEAAGLLYDTARALRGPGDIAEIGPRKGKSTVALGLAVRASGCRRTVYAIVPPRGGEEERELGDRHASDWPAFQGCIREARLTTFVRPLKMSAEGAAGCLAEEGARLRFLCVDGARDEDSVRKDIEAFLPLLLPGALIALDDARPDGPFPGAYRAWEKTLGGCTRTLGFTGKILLVQLEGTPDARSPAEADLPGDAEIEGASSPPTGAAGPRRRVAFFTIRKKGSMQTTFIDEALQRAGCDVLSIRESMLRRRYGGKLAARLIRSRLAAFDPDVVLIFSNHIHEETLDFATRRWKTAILLDDFFPAKGRHLELIRKVDVFFLTNTGQLDEYRRNGARRAVYVYNGVDPFRHTRSAPRDAFRSEIAFIGRAIYPERLELVRRLAGDFDLKVYGRDWEKIGLRSTETQIGPSEYSQVCASAKIILGMDKSADLELYFSNRTFYVLGCGGFLLTRYVPGLERVFANHRHLVWYRDADEALELAAHYLRHDRERERIATQGHDFVHANYPVDRAMLGCLRLLFEDREPFPLVDPGPGATPEGLLSDASASEATR